MHCCLWPLDGSILVVSAEYTFSVKTLKPYYFFGFVWFLHYWIYSLEKNNETADKRLSISNFTICWNIFSFFSPKFLIKILRQTTFWLSQATLRRLEKTRDEVVSMFGSTRLVPVLKAVPFCYIQKSMVIWCLRVPQSDTAKGKVGTHNHNTALCHMAGRFPCGTWVHSIN